MKEYNIAAIPGDGIGKEVVPEGIKVLKETAKKHQFKIHFDEYSSGVVIFRYAELTSE